MRPPSVACGRAAVAAEHDRLMPLRPCCRSYEVEENKRLVLDEVEDTGLTPGLTGLTRARGRRARRRNAWDRRVVAATPVFYGWVVAALAALSAVIVSPAQVFCVGVVVDAIVKDTQPMTRLDVSRAYASSPRHSSPSTQPYSCGCLAVSSSSAAASACAWGCCYSRSRRAISRSPSVGRSCRRSGRECSTLAPTPRCMTGGDGGARRFPSACMQPPRASA